MWPTEQVGLVPEVEPEKPMPAQRQAVGTECIPSVPADEAPERALATRTDNSPSPEYQRRTACAVSLSRLVDRTPERGDSLQDPAAHPAAEVVRALTSRQSHLVRPPFLACAHLSADHGRMAKHGLAWGCLTPWLKYLAKSG